jgi:hypothetical protein
MYFLFYFFVPYYFIVRRNKKFSGLDERPNTHGNKTDMSLIKTNIRKNDLLKKLQTNTISEQEKIKNIYDCPSLMGLNVNNICAPNVSKGLQWD